jgi:Inward rectifier potassium channel transmembrane domain
MPIIRKDSFRWLMPKTSQRRLVCKNGECNISRVNIDKRGRRYLADIFTTLVDIKWRWILLVFTMAFTLSWIIFALLWWLIAFSHRDLQNYGKSDWKPCVQEVRTRVLSSRPMRRLDILTDSVDMTRCATAPPSAAVFCGLLLLL